MAEAPRMVVYAYTVLRIKIKVAYTKYLGYAFPYNQVGGGVLNCESL
jgi:hypothetical protein